MTPNPIENACRLLREGAAELKNCHTLAATGHDWTGEPEAKAAYDEHMATADALERVHAECEALRTGYAAARLEIESLRARCVEPVGERTPKDYAIEHAEYMAQDAERLLEAINHLNAQRDEDGEAFDSDALAHAEEAATEAFGAVRNGIYEFRKRRDRAAAQPAGAQQPGADPAALPAGTYFARACDGKQHDTGRVYIRREQGHPSGASFFAETASPEDAEAIAAAMNSASHGQAPAQAAPAAVAGPHVTDAMALAFHSALSDGALGSDEVEDIKAGLRAALDAAPTTQPAPVHADASYEAMNLAVMVLSDCGHSSNYKPLLERVAGRIDRHVERLLTAQQADIAMRAQAAPQPSPASQGDVLDAARYRYLTRSMGDYCITHAADHLGGVLKAAAADAAIDAARAAQDGGDIAMFTTPAQRGELAGDGKPCNNDHDPDCRWPECICRTREEAAARAAQEGK